MYEKNLESRSLQMKDFKKSTIAKEIESYFPDAKLIDIKIEKKED